MRPRKHAFSVTLSTLWNSIPPRFDWAKPCQPLEEFFSFPQGFGQGIYMPTVKINILLLCFAPKVVCILFLHCCLYTCFFLKKKYIHSYIHPFHICCPLSCSASGQPCKQTDLEEIKHIRYEWVEVLKFRFMVWVCL